MIFAWPSSLTMTLAGRQIAVDDPLVVRGGEPLGHLARHLHRATDRQASASEHVAKALAADELHRDERRALGFAHFVDRGDVRMLQRRRGLGLLHEAAAALGVGDELRKQHLERDFAVERRVDRSVDDAHAAAAELADERVVGQRAAGHEASHMRIVRFPADTTLAAAARAADCAGAARAGRPAMLPSPVYGRRATVRFGGTAP